MRLNIIISAMFVVLQVTCNAQFSYSDNVKHAQNAILDLDFTNYESIKLNKQPSELGLYFWLDAYKIFIEYKTTEKILDPDSVVYQVEYCIHKIEQLPDSESMGFYCLTDLHLMLGYIFFEQGESIRALAHYIEAKRLMKKYRKDANFKLLGKHLIIENTVNYLFNQQLGIAGKSQAESQAEYFNLINDKKCIGCEAYGRELKLLGIFLYDLQFPESASLCINELHIDFTYTSKGPLETLAGAIVFKNAENYDLQMEFLSNALKFGYMDRFNQLNFWYGNAHLNQLNDSAIYYLDRFLKRQQNSMGVTYAKYKEVLYWYAKHNKVKTEILIKNIHNELSVGINADRQAKYEIENIEFWTLELVNAWLLFDGGNYQKALSVLLQAKDKVKNYSNEQKLEYSYRLARIYDKLDDFYMAERFYKIAINSNLDKEFYYPAYAAYYLGIQYKRSGSTALAKKYFSICTQLESPIYKSSIHNKAKQELR